MTTWQKIHMAVSVLTLVLLAATMTPCYVQATLDVPAKPSEPVADGTSSGGGLDGSESGG